MNATKLWKEGGGFVQSRLACLVAACVLPGWICAGYLVHYSYASKRALIERHMLETAQVLTLALDQELASIQAALQAMSTSPSLDTGDMAAFQKQAQEVLLGYEGSDVVMADAGGQQIINSYLPFGRKLPKRNIPDGVRRVFETGRPHISGLFRGAVTGRPLVSVDVPVLDHGRTAYDLGMTVPAGRFASVIDPGQLPDDWMVTVLDRSLNVVARTGNQEQLSGQPLQADSPLRRTGGAAYGTLELADMESVPVVASFNRSTVSGWTVLVSVPKAVLLAEPWRWLWWTIGGTALLSVAGVGSALLMGRGIAGEIRSLVPPALALGRGEPVAAPKLKLVETNKVAKALEDASRLLHQRASEREAAEALRGRTEAQLEERERMFRIVADNSYNWEFWTAPDGSCRWVSPACERISGYSAREFTAAGGITIRSLIHPEDVEAWDAHIEESDGRRSPHAEIEFRIIRRDGETTHISHTCEPVYNLKGEYLGRRGCNRDITEQKRIEDDLRAAKDLAETANRSKSEFLANMSHEIRTPLNGTLGMLQLLEETPLNREQQGYARLALKSGRSLLSVLNDILDFSKIEAGKLMVDEKPLFPRELLEAVRELFGEEARRAGISLACEVDGAVPPAVLGDFARLRQVLFNLVGNSVKFTPTGGITVRVSADQDGRRLVFSVSDTGIGMPEEKLDTLFEPFIQADGSYTRKKKGVGLGLSIVKRLVTLMGGGLTAESGLGRGTTITFDVPLNATEAETARQAAAAPAVDPRGLQVLLVEDEAINRMTFRRILEKRGFTVHCACNGLEALSVLDREQIGVVLMDIQMPEMDGIEATRRIRDSERFGDKSRVPIIALTAHAMNGDRESFLAAGMDDYVSKPVEIASLLGALSRFSPDAPPPTA